MKIRSLHTWLPFLVVCTIGLVNGDVIYGQRGGGPPSTFTAEAGYVFIDNVYVESPYEVEFVNGILSINGTVLDESTIDLSGYANRRRGEGRPRGARLQRGRFQFSPLRLFHQELTRLHHGTVLLINSERQPEFLHHDFQGHEFLEYLLAGCQSEQLVEVPDSIEDEADRDSWRQVANQFEPTPEFLQRARPQVEATNKLQEKVESVVAAQRLSDRLMYPFTMFAFVLVVFAVGHLMAIAQPTFGANLDLQANERTIKSVSLSLTIVAMLSAFDLAWTLMAHKSGSMRELNPIGAQFISDPAQLVLFKAVVSGAAIGLFFWLRRVPLARKATWWCCLVLTLLTIRWLTFNSMFA